LLAGVWLNDLAVDSAANSLISAYFDMASPWKIFPQWFSNSIGCIRYWLPQAA
jgi:hypothetical protein